MSSENLFHAAGPEYKMAYSPNLVRSLGKWQLVVLAERKPDRVAVAATVLMRSLMYECMYNAHKVTTFGHFEYYKSAVFLAGAAWSHTPMSAIYLHSSVIFVNENENGEKRENNEFVNEN